MQISSYTKTDERAIRKALVWLNTAARKQSRVIRITNARGDVEVGEALAILWRNDPRLNIEPLVINLNNLVAAEPRRFRKYQRWALAKVNEQLKECQMFPQIKGMGGQKPVVFWFSSGRCDEKTREYQAMMLAVISLHERGLLSAVRQCVCGRWFHAAHGKRQFHTALCRSRAHYANLSPQAKARRRKLMRNRMRKMRAEKMREYRALEKEKSERALRRAKESK
jgi:hypothetical protein